MKREKTRRFEILFDEGNSVSYTIRFPKGLLDLLQEESEKQGIPLATYIRDLLSFHFVPDMLESFLRESPKLDPADQEVYGLFRDYVLYLDSKILEVLKYQRLTTKLKARLFQLERLITEKADAAIKEVSKESKKKRPVS